MILVITRFGALQIHASAESPQTQSRNGVAVMLTNVKLLPSLAVGRTFYEKILGLLTPLYAPFNRGLCRIEPRFIRSR